MSALSCNNDPKEFPDIIGTFTWADWQNKSGWKDHSASDYIPDNGCVESLKIFVDGYNLNFEIYASNWCHIDCALQVPRLIKFLKAAEVKESDIMLYGLNRHKTDPVDAMAKWSAIFPSEICYVPTLVIYINDSIVVGKVKCETLDFPAWQCKIAEQVQSFVTN